MPVLSLELKLCGIQELHIDADLVPGLDLLLDSMQGVCHLSVYIGRNCTSSDLNSAHTLATRMHHLQEMTVYFNNANLTEYEWQETTPRSKRARYGVLNVYLIDGHRASPYLHAYVFCHIGLKELNVYFPYKFNAIANVVGRIAERCPGLKRLRLDVCLFFFSSLYTRVAS